VYNETKTKYLEILMTERASSKMLFLVSLEHEDDYITTYLVHATDMNEAEGKVDAWLSEEFSEREGDWYVYPENDDKLRIENISVISNLDDLEQLLPLIE
jgi:hypothetical protein